MKKAYIISALAAICILGLLLSGPIAQDVHYHNFADQRRLWNIPNFYNVVTNLPFALIAILGYRQIRRTRHMPLKTIGYSMFTGFFLLTFGSGYYHLFPSNDTLMFDRIPIMLIIMSFLTYIFYSHNRTRNPLRALALLNLAGILTVLYWAWTERSGNGDLRWYGFAQFFPLIAIPMLLWLYRAPKSYWPKLIPIFLFFGLAKMGEKFDVEVYHMLGNNLSGHSLKHLFMSAAGFKIISFWKRAESI